MTYDESREFGRKSKSNLNPADSNKKKIKAEINEKETANNAKNQWVSELAPGKNNQERQPLAQWTRRKTQNQQNQKPLGKQLNRHQRNTEYLGECFKNLCSIELENLKEISEFLDSSKLLVKPRRNQQPKQTHNGGWDWNRRKQNKNKELFFKKRETDRLHPKQFYEASIILIPKPG